MKPTPIAVIFFSVLMLLSFRHCKKATDEGEISVARDASLAKLVITDALLQAQEGLGRAKDTLEGRVSAGGIIDFTTDAELSISSWDTLWPKLITIDYPVPVILKDGRSRSGIITIQANGYWQDTSLTATVAYTNYFLEEHRVSGSIEISQLTKDEYITFVINTNDLKTVSAADTILCSFTGEYTWEKGSNTPYPLSLDDEYLLTGNGRITNTDSDYSFEIIQPLRKRNNCPWINSGAVEFISDEAESETLNYGRGGCDATASAVKGDEEIFFRLK